VVVVVPAAAVAAINITTIIATCFDSALSSSTQIHHDGVLNKIW
jgi:hypothetical protein